jgi:hypothetical protein
MYQELADTATKLLSEFGQKVLLKSSTKTNNTVTGEVSEVANPNLEAYAVEVDAETALGSSGKGLTATESEKFLLVDSVNEIEKTMIISMYDGEYSIERLKPLSPAGKVLLYGAHIKK